MKTLHNTTAQNLNRKREHVRLGMILAGIATAIICSMALLYETPSMHRAVSVPRVIETPKMAAANLSVEVIGGAVVSAIWPF